MLNPDPDLAAEALAAAEDDADIPWGTILEQVAAAAAEAHNAYVELVDALFPDRLPEDLAAATAEVAARPRHHHVDLTGGRE